MNLAIHSITCPRIEVDFIEHWIEYHLKLGVSKIYLYNLGVELFYESKPEYVNTDKGVERVATKRKHMEVDVRTDDEIVALWDNIISKYTNVIEIKPDLSMYKRNRGSYDTIQRILNFSENSRYCDEKIDWIANIDIDEYLCGDINFLNNLPKEVAHVQLAQKVYKDRWDELGYPREFSLDEIPLTNNLLTICQKNIVRPHALNSWRNIHYDVVLHPGYSKIWGGENIFFKHFRGFGYADTVNKKASN